MYGSRVKDNRRDCRW